MYRVESFIFGLQQTPSPLHRPFAVCVSSPQPITHNTFQTCFPALYSSSLYSPDHPFSDVLRPIRVHHEHKMSSTQSEWQPRQNHSPYSLPLPPTPKPTFCMPRTLSFSSYQSMPCRLSTHFVQLNDSSLNFAGSNDHSQLGSDHPVADVDDERSTKAFVFCCA